jgi:hypothetical protein
VKEVVERVEEITAEWLSRAIRTEVRAVRAVPVGTGQTGASYRLLLDWDGESPTVIAKMAGGDIQARRQVAGGYRREVGFYSQLVATLDIRAPYCWYSAITDDAQNFTLIMEDLAPRKPGRQVEGCTLNQARDAILSLAGLHASRWNDQSLFDLDFIPPTTGARAEFLGGLTVAGTEQFVARFGAELEPADVMTLQECGRAVGPWLLIRPRPVGVCHGDFRLDNLMFPPEGHGVVVIDWQTLDIAPPARDLAYFLGTSLKVKLRRVAQDELISLYHAGLVQRGVAEYEMSRCFDDYRLGLLQGPMITMIGYLYATGEQTIESDRMFFAMARRSCAAIRDMRTLEFL